MKVERNHFNQFYLGLFNFSIGHQKLKGMGIMMKKLRRYIFLPVLIIIPLLITVYICKDRFINSDNKNNKNIKIGVTLYDQSDPFILSISSGLEQVSKEIETEKGNRITLNVVSADGSQIQQNDQVDLFIEQGVDVICINIVDRTASSIIIDKARNANIPIIFFNREPVEEDMNRWDKLYYVGILASLTGTLQGELVIEAIDNPNKNIDKNMDGKIQYVLLEGEPGHQDASIRTEYCIKTIQDAGVELEKLANESADWKRDLAAMKVTQWAEEYGDEIEVIISNNDDMALGAIDVLREMNYYSWPLIVGVNGLESAKKEIEENSLYGTVDINAPETAESIIKLACSLAWGTPPGEAVELVSEKYTYADQSIITKESLSQEKENYKTTSQ